MCLCICVCVYVSVCVCTFMCVRSCLCKRIGICFRCEYGSDIYRYAYSYGYGYRYVHGYRSDICTGVRQGAVPPPWDGHTPLPPPVGWCGVWNSIGFSFKNKCVSIPCHAMRCHFHMLRAMILFMRALQHLLFFMLSYVLSCKLFHLALIEFICIFIGFNMFHEPPRPPLWDGMGLEISLNYLVPP